MLQPDGFERRKKIYDAQRTLRRSRLTGHPYFQVRASAPTPAVADQCSEILKGQFQLLQMLRVMGQAPQVIESRSKVSLGAMISKAQGTVEPRIPQCSVSATAVIGPPEMSGGTQS
jgi:hypothetical protein